MRKKSHIFLAKYIVEQLDEQALCKHRKAFYLGSILPDCKPSFLTTKHEIQGTFGQVQEKIIRLSKVETPDETNLRAYFRDLGQVIHYVADYFTFPHNPQYPGSLKEHFVYEEQLEHSLQEYIVSGEAEKRQRLTDSLDSPEAICSFIRKAHDAYLRWKNNVEHDCRAIVSLCCQVVYAIIRLFVGKNVRLEAKAA